MDVTNEVSTVHVPHYVFHTFEKVQLPISDYTCTIDLWRYSCNDKICKDSLGTIGDIIYYLDTKCDNLVAS